MISCPEYQNGKGILQIFREADRLPLGTIIGELGFSDLGLAAQSTSIAGKVDTILFYSSNGTLGQINSFEVFWNSRDSLLFETILTKDIFSIDFVIKFAKYFEYTKNKIFASSENSHTWIPYIQIIPFCLYDQIFDKDGTKECIALDSSISKLISLGSQDVSGSSCS